MANYITNAALVGLAVLTLATSGCGGATAPSTENGGYDRSVVVTEKKDKNGRQIGWDVSTNGYDQNKSTELTRNGFEYAQRRFDAENAHTETMYTTAADKIERANKNLPANTKSTSGSDPAKMQEDLYERSLKL